MNCNALVIDRRDRVSLGRVNNIDRKLGKQAYWRCGYKDVLCLDWCWARYVTGNNKAEVFERVECVANYALGLVFPYEKDFTQVCRCCWTSRRSTGDNANYEADFDLPRFCTLDRMVNNNSVQVIQHKLYVTYGVNGDNDLDRHILTSLNSSIRQGCTKKLGLGSCEEGGEDNEELHVVVDLAQRSFVLVPPRSSADLLRLL